MANNKIGLSYYNIDTDRYQDIRIKRLRKDFGCSGIAVYDYILCEIYRVKGYFIAWDENTAFDVAEYFGLKETLVKDIVDYCCAVGLYDKELLTSESILTSSSIQSRYVEMCNRAKRINIKIREEYSKLREVCPKPTEVYPKKEEVCRKVKKSKDNISPPAHMCEDDLFEIDLTKCYYALDNNQSWKETICMNTRIVHKNFTPDDLTQHLKAFFRKLQNEGEKTKTPRDAMSHFARWLESKLNTKNDGKTRRKTDIQPPEKAQKNYSGGF